MVSRKIIKTVMSSNLACVVKDLRPFEKKPRHPFVDVPKFRPKQGKSFS